jgi:zinc/manganese transport system substrate-binding protein
MPSKNVIMDMKLIVLISLLLTSGHAIGKLRIFACEPEWAALSLALGGDQLNVFSATTSGQDPHFIQARPSLIAKARRADLLICSGAGLESSWLPLLLRKSSNGRILPGTDGHFMATDYVGLLDKPITLDRSQGDAHAAGNPHVHLDPARMLVIGQALQERLMLLDPGSSTMYESNYRAFKAELSSMLVRRKQQIVDLQGAEVVVHHNSWVYLAEWLKLQQVATIEPKPGIPPSSNFLGTLVKRLTNQTIRYIIRSNYQNPRASEWLAVRIDVSTRTLPYSPPDWKSEDALIHWYASILTTLSDSN